MRKVLFTLCCSILAFATYAQTVDDVYNISNPQLQGDARYLATGGAFGALGGNIYAIGTNPAGAGVFINNEFSVSLGFPLSLSNSIGGLNGNSSTAQLTIPNIGVVGTVNIPKSQLKAFNISITNNRVQDYYKSNTINAISNHSMADFFADQADGYYASEFSADANEAPLPFTSYLAYQAYLINPVSDTKDTNQYYSAFENEVSSQTVTFKQRGAMSETNITGGLNFMDKYYVGLGIGIARLRYSFNQIHSEVFDYNNYLGSFDYETDLKVDGFGLNVKIGGIMRINESLRVGAFYHTPTSFSVEDTYFTRVTTDIVSHGQEEEATIKSNFSYRYVQSGKFGFSGAYLFNKRGFLSFDYTYSALNNSRYKNSLSSFATIAELSADFKPTNQDVFKILQPVHTLALGFEYKFGPMAVRAGYRYQTIAYSSEINIDNTPYNLNYSANNTYSVGLGFRNNNFFIDGGLAINTFKENKVLYELSYLRTPDYQINYTKVNLVGTVGFNF